MYFSLSMKMNEDEEEETRYLMVTVDAMKHHVCYLSYDLKDREKNNEIYMWAMEILTFVIKHKKAYGFCQFLRVAHENKWKLLPNTCCNQKELIYLFQYTLC